MSFISKSIAKLSSSSPVTLKQAERLPNRFGGGIVPMGHVVREPRTNTSKELLESIEAYADVYEGRSEAAVEELLETAKVYGVNLKKEAKAKGIDIFEAGKRQGSIAADFESVDPYTGEKIVKRKTLNLTELAENLRLHKQKADTNSHELRQFLTQAKGMDERQLGVAQDIIDLAHVESYFSTPVTLQQIIDNGRTIMGDLLARLPEISRRNPGAVELAESVFNHSDGTNAKFFLRTSLVMI